MKRADAGRPRALVASCPSLTTAPLHDRYTFETIKSLLSTWDMFAFFGLLYRLRVLHRPKSLLLDFVFNTTAE